MDRPPSSQASSHFPLEPIPASVLADGEVDRRNALVAGGNCTTGCPELDDYVLLGGLERGCVVGVSAEDEEMGLQLALQILAHSLSANDAVHTALIITPKPPSTILGALRSSIQTELQASQDGLTTEHLAARTRACLDRVLLSCVFDLDGLWEVLADLDKPAPEKQEEEEEKESDERDESPEQETKPVDEIQDSQDESLSPLSQPEPPPPPPPPDSHPRAASALPALIVITHFSSLLTSLFTHRDKSAAHSALQLLHAHLRHLTRHLPSSPLVLILNSTTTISTTSTTTSTTTPAADSGTYAEKPSLDGQAPPPRSGSVDPTLRSVFNPPPLPVPGYAHAHAHAHAHAAAASAARRSNKPSFGLVFSQLLDMHLLCTRLRRAQHDDAEAAVTTGPVPSVWVVECLLDEMGVWTGELGPRRSREQRWTAVQVEGDRVRDAFGTRDSRRNTADVRLAGGFGGRRV